MTQHPTAAAERAGTGLGTGLGTGTGTGTGLGLAVVSYLRVRGTTALPGARAHGGARWCLRVERLTPGRLPERMNGARRRRFAPVSPSPC
ncbi:hypothetical protein ACFY8C_27295 [Streptomyces flavochromogenes]|uniref:Uncharacterized protein n=1 Tax=Streptomyces flavochromogenes TaxID=68199 RepID=A0ABW6XWZ0_9ACTN